MKTKYWILLFAVLFVLCALGGWLLLRPGQDAAAAEIWSGGERIKTVSLAENQSFEVQTASGSNTVTVRDGAIAVTAATCPDHYCMNRGYCSGGADIVCLPNRLVIKFITQSPDAVDATVG